MQRRFKSFRPSKYLGAILSTVLFLALVVMAELVGWCVLRYQGKDTHRPFYRAEAVREAEGVFDHRISYSYLDPHLSHAHNAALLEEQGMEVDAGFVAYGASEADHDFLVVTLGGSTTDPAYRHLWPMTLAELLAEAGRSARVLNGGVAGYSSNQELIKLVRDALPREPDLVVSFNGINDLGFAHSVAIHPMVHPYQRKVLRFVAGDTVTAPKLLPNAVSLALGLLEPTPEVGVSYGTVVRRKDHEQWLINVRAMHALSREFGVGYVCFLQPVLGAGTAPLFPEDQAMLDETVESLAPHRDYLEDVRQFYAGAREAARGLPYVVDLSTVLDGKRNMYEDARHQTPEGGRVVATAILRHLRAAGLVQSGEPSR